MPRTPPRPREPTTSSCAPSEAASSAPRSRRRATNTGGDAMRQPFGINHLNGCRACATACQRRDRSASRRPLLAAAAARVVVLGLPFGAFGPVGRAESTAQLAGSRGKMQLAGGVVAPMRVMARMWSAAHMRTGGGGGGMEPPYYRDNSVCGNRRSRSRCRRGRRFPRQLEASPTCRIRHVGASRADAVTIHGRARECTGPGSRRED